MRCLNYDGLMREIALFTTLTYECKNSDCGKGTIIKPCMSEISFVNVIPLKVRIGYSFPYISFSYSNYEVKYPKKLNEKCQLKDVK